MNEDRSSAPWSLAGARVLVTGASRGIGRAILTECVRRGASALAVARGEEDLAEAVVESRTLAAPESAVHALATDATSADGRLRIVSALAEHLGGCDRAFFNVGTNIRKPLLDYDEAELDHLFATNQRGTLDLLRATHPTLARGVDPAVVLVGSVAGIQGIRTGAPYAMAKAALHQLARVLAGEWGPAGIRVNALAPWYTRTPLVAELLADEATETAIIERTPLRRIAEPEEVARAALFLALPAASFVTGHTLAVDGGFCAFTY